MRAFFYLLAVCAAICVAARADEITMKNGDRLTGTIVKSDSKELVLKTDYAGEITMKWDAVQQATSSGAVFVTSKSGQVLNGTVQMSGSDVQVQSSETGRTTLARDAVAAIRSPEEQRVFQTWSGGVDLGLSLARGNSEVSNFALAANADRTTLRDKTTAFVTSLVAKNKLNGISQTTANAIRGGLRYDYNLGSRTFVFAFTDLEHDRFQRLDLRNVLGGGLGAHVIKTERTTLDLDAGASFDQEFFTGLTRRSGEALFGDQLTFKLSNATALTQQFTVFPNLSDLGQYRLAFDLGAVTKLSRYLGWQIGLSERYISNPIPGTLGNDLLLSTGLRVVFGGTKL